MTDEFTRKSFNYFVFIFFSSQMLDDAIKIVDVRCKNQNNTSDEYRSIPRSISSPPTEDADGT